MGLRASPLLVVLLFLLPAATAAEWGVHRPSGEAEIEIPGEAPSYWVCVAAMPHRDEVVLRQGDVERVFRPTEARADCRTLPGDALVADLGNGSVRVLVLAQPPREASGPGVFRLVNPGVAVAVRDASAAAEVGILRQGDVSVQVIRMDTLEVVQAVAEGTETRFAPDEEVSAAGLVVAVTGGGDDASALVEWSDPDWYRRSPTIGHVAVVVAIALFLTLYRGKSPRRLG